VPGFLLPQPAVFHMPEKHSFLSGRRMKLFFRKKMKKQDNRFFTKFQDML